jgi:hypothetical protein
MYGIALVLFASLLVAVNVWFWRKRRGMTPEQRRQHDESLKFDQSVW